MATIDRRNFLLGASGAMALPLLGCGGGGGGSTESSVPLPPSSSANAPMAVALDGVQYEVHANSHTLVITSRSGTRTTVGGVGRELGKLNYPADVVVVGGLAYVVEIGNHRVQIFDSTGQSRGTIGEGELLYPGGIAARGNEIFVSDSRNGRVVGFTPDGKLTRILGAGQLSAPRGLAVVDDGLLVADAGLRTVAKFGWDGRGQGVFGQNWVLPWDVATDGTLLFVADHSRNEVVVLDSAGQQVGTIAHTQAPSFLTFREGELFIV